MIKKILLSKQAEKFLSRQDAKNYQRITDKIKELANIPKSRNLDIKPLKGKYANMYRLRVGSRRILFTLEEEEKTIKVWIIEDRGDIY